MQMITIISFKDTALLCLGNHGLELDINWADQEAMIQSAPLPSKSVAVQISLEFWNCTGRK